VEDPENQRKEDQGVRQLMVPPPFPKKLAEDDGPEQRDNSNINPMQNEKH
jgi:hypothetical protein